jgi:predicted RNase H-like nuclease (RuvC/YqgF family)
MAILDMYRQKKKRVVDPNAPPRPNLLSHEKVLKDVKMSNEQRDQEINRLQRRVDELENKLRNQTAYLSSLHQTVHNLLKKN